MFLNKTLIKGSSIKQRAEKINQELVKISVLSTREQSIFATKFELDEDRIQEAMPYFNQDRSEQVYKWCLGVGKDE